MNSATEPFSRAATAHLALLVFVNEINWGIVSLGGFRWALACAVWLSPFVWLLRLRGLPPSGGVFPFLALIAWSAWTLLAAAWSDAVLAGHLVAVGIVASALAAAVYSAMFGWERLCRVVALSLALFLTIGLIYELASGGMDGRFSGIGRNPTDAGRIGVVMGLTGLAGFRHVRSMGPTFMLFGLVTAMLADARTASFGLVLAVVYIASRRTDGGVRIGTSVMTGVLLILGLSLLGGQTAAEELVARTESGVDLATFTGRVEIWELSVAEARRAPLIGLGTASSPDLFEQALHDGRLDWDAGNAHNLWIHTQLEHGVVGSVLLFLVVAGIIVAGRAFPNPERDGLLLALLLNSFTEALLHEPSISVIVLAGAVGTFVVVESRRSATPSTASYHDRRPSSGARVP